MALPANVGTCLVTGTFIRAVIDSVDADRDPDGVPIEGLTVKFTASVPMVRNVSAVPPVMVFMDPIICTTNISGTLIGLDGQPGIRLVASDDPDLDPSGWTYKAELSAPTLPKFSFSFVAPVGGTVDLSTVVPVPPAPGASLVAWQEAVVTATAARDEAVIAAADADAARDEAVIVAAAIPATNDPVVAALVNDPASETEAALNAAFTPIGRRGRTLVDLETYIGNDVDVTDALKAAVVALGGVGTIIVPSGLEARVSEPIDLNGCSLFGFDRFASTFYANPATTDWRVDPVAGAVNDVAVFFAYNKNRWSIRGIGLDAQNVYSSGLVAEGGDFITFADNYVRGTGAQCGLQFMGARKTGQAPVRYSMMTGNISEGNLWNYVLDGDNFDVRIINNLGVDAAARHVSIDPNEAKLENARESRGVVLMGNTFEGVIPRPPEWDGYPTAAVADYAVRVGTNSRVGYVTMQGNSIRNWNATHGISLTAGGIVSGNIIECDTETGRGGGSGIHVLAAAPGLLVTGNTVRNYNRGFTIDNSQRVEVSRNRFEDVTSRWVINGVTYESGSPASAGAGSRFIDNSWDDQSWGIYETRSKHDTIFISPAQMQINQGSPEQSWTGGRTPCWLMDAASIEAVAFTFVTPDEWSSAELELYWSAPSGTGDVVWQVQLGIMSAGNALPDGGNPNPDITVTAGTANRLIITNVPVGLGSIVPGRVMIGEVRRQANNVADTLASDAALIGVRITRTT